VGAGSPVPLRGAEPSLPTVVFTESLVASDALRRPSALGVKVIVTMQLSPGKNGLVLALNAPQALFVIVKSPALVPLICTTNPTTGTPPMVGLVIVIL
jgi:hypothetical protein